MKMIFLQIVLVLVFVQLSSAQGQGEVTNGMSRSDVIELLGVPKGSGVGGGGEMLLFSSGTVTLRNGKVIASKLLSSAEAGERQRRLDEQRIRVESARKSAPPVPAAQPQQQGQPQQPVAAGAGGSLDWQTDFPKALADAAQSHRYMLLDFTGSDWCHFCIKLDEEVFSSPEFQAFAARKFICAKLDFPRKKSLPAELTKQNTELGQKYGVRGYPTVVILSADGTLVGQQTGYGGTGPLVYVETLKKMIEDYEQAHPAK